ncbi:MAG: HAD hydrolase family protein [Faecalibacterium sp.]
MNQSLADTLVLCDLDTLLLGEDGNLTQVVRDVLQLFSSRGGRFTVFSQRSPRAVRTILGSLRLSAPALLCGGTLAYSFAEGSGQPLCGFEALDDGFLTKLPAAAGVGIALQMKDGTTRVLRMSQSLEQHLRQEWTPFLLNHAADVRSSDVLRVLLYQDGRRSPTLLLFEKALAESAAPLTMERMASDVLVLTPRGVTGKAMLDAVCGSAGLAPENVLVLAGSMPMLELLQASGSSAVGADAPAELRLAARQVALTDCAGGAAAEILYGLVRSGEGRGGVGVKKL